MGAAQRIRLVADSRCTTGFLPIYSVGGGLPHNHPERYGFVIKEPPIGMECVPASG
jgi:hypothetical protein